MGKRRKRGNYDRRVREIGQGNYVGKGCGKNYVEKGCGKNYVEKDSREGGGER